MEVVGKGVAEVLKSIATDDAEGSAKVLDLEKKDDVDTQAGVGRRKTKEASLLSSEEHPAAPCSHRFWPCNALLTLFWESLTWR